MQERIVAGRTVSEWMEEYPTVRDIAALRETAWRNPDKLPAERALADCELTIEDVKDAEARLERFAAFFESAYPETRATKGIIESPVATVPHLQEALGRYAGIKVPGTLMMKLDSHLPISGSIKARGGIYEVLKTAEDIALREGILHEGDSYAVLDTLEAREVMSRYAICVGSTGNLGLSIGVVSARLGFHVTVHMSADARQWKKDMLRSKGVTVIEHEQDYGVAVARGREDAKDDPYCHFVDDENSRTLFLGYSVAALRLRRQFDEQGILVDGDHPLFVYLPCGVGGGPGGVAFGLKCVFGDAVHCFFAEPTHSCSMLLGMSTGQNDKLSVQDFGVDNKTAADGLAVGRPSSFVGTLMRPFMSGCYSLSDERMYELLALTADAEGIELEPSALAGLYGPVLLRSAPAFQEYVRKPRLTEALPRSTQLVWATGGSLVPDDVMHTYYNHGKELLSAQSS